MVQKLWFRMEDGGLWFRITKEVILLGDLATLIFGDVWLKAVDYFIKNLHHRCSIGL